MTTAVFGERRETGRPLSKSSNRYKASWNHSARSCHSPVVVVSSSWLLKAPATLSWFKTGGNEQHPPLHALCLHGISPRNTGIKNTTLTKTPFTFPGEIWSKRKWVRRSPPKCPDGKVAFRGPQRKLRQDPRWVTACLPGSASESDMTKPVNYRFFQEWCQRT